MKQDIEKEFRKSAATILITVMAQHITRGNSGKGTVFKAHSETDASIALRICERGKMY